MSVFSRVSDIVVANIHALLDRADSEALLAQVIREMEAGLAEARRSAAVAVAAERRLVRERDQHRAAADHWKGRAKEALGDAGTLADSSGGSGRACTTTSDFVGRVSAT